MRKDTYLSDWLEGKISDQELAQFESKEDIILLKNIKNISAEANVPQITDCEMLQEILQTKKTKLIKYNFNKVIGIAASFAFFMVAFLVFYLTNYQSVLNNSNQAIAFYLPDQSKVILLSNAQADFQKLLWNSNREISLKGNAYFEVKRGEKFTVKTKSGSVNVLGTKFFVQSDQNQFNVTCLEGKVQVKQYNNQQVILTKGAKVSFVGNKKLYFENNKNYTDFSKQQFVFNNVNLAEVINQINFHYNKNISLLNKKDVSFYGNLPMNDFNEALIIIQQTSGLSVLKKSNNQYLLN